MLDQNTQKNEMETGDEKCIFTGRKTGNESSRMETYRAVGRPKKRWEDEINDFLRPERTEDEISNVERNNNEWIKTAKDQEGWKKKETSSQSRQQHLAAQEENGCLCMTPDAYTTQLGKTPSSFQT